ncbi:VaFE repeat-containing surface-anchored protein [Eubacterium sp.]|uniref:VaFE repeat-containing surface-anchored protein n=1 Tax=Eubacterium sp. TaxID=142586 RepID=UPI00258C56C2|nr:VaFE repeat-containing surface-anchored protein [Eubacterium sp.]MCR5367163.1 VaFE repeat-containing surface-anchored protein [Eubacterium sp.]
MKKKKKFLALLLAVSLAISNGSYVSAEEATPSDAEAVSEQEASETPDTEYDVVDSEGNVVEEGVSEEGSDKKEEETPVVTDKVTEQVTEEVTTEIAVIDKATSEEKQPTFTAPVEGVDVSGIDFTSKQLLVGTEDENIFTWDTIVLSSYNGIYLTEYASEEETKNAYTYYYGKADVVDANITFTVSDDEESEGSTKETADLSEINTGDDAISNLADMDTTGTVPEGTIAVIDTGSNGNTYDAVSLIGDNTADDNGHGTKVINAIQSAYPDANIVSVKALGSDGRCDVATLYAAISYAIEKKVSIINLSVSSVSTAESDTIREVIDRAVANGIVVVGAAGNNGKNAKYYVPGGIDSAIIVGSYNENGEKNNNSNYGPTVDYYLKANSTSIAAAKMSAVIAKDGIEAIEKNKEDGYIYYPASEDRLDTEGTVKYSHDNAIYFEGAANRNAGVVAPSWYNKVKSYITGTLGMTIDTDYGYWSANSVTNNEVCATLVSRIINNSYPDEYHVTATDSAPTLYNTLNNSSKWTEITGSNTWYYHSALFNDDWINLIRPGDVIFWADSSSGPATHVEIATLSGCVYNNGEGEDYNPFYGYRRWVDWEYRSGNGVSGSTSSGKYFKVFRTVDAKDYYIAIKKQDSRGYAMNGVSFDVSFRNNDTNSNVNIKGEYSDGKYKGIWSGYMNNQASSVPKSYRETSNEGVGVFYLGKFSSAPTNISVTENWRGRVDSGSGWAGGRAELVMSSTNRPNVYARDYAPNSSSKSVTAYNTEAEAISHAATYTYTNYHFAYTTLEKEASNKSLVVNNPHYSMTGIKYGLYGDAACTELIATVTLTDNSNGTAKIASLNDITINKTLTNNNSEPYKATVDGKHSVGGLMWGTYYWKEISAPAASGYAVNTSSKPAAVSVSYASSPLVVIDSDKAYLNYYVSVKKVDQSGNTMNGVTFDLTVNGTTKKKAMTTGKYVNGSTTANTTAGIATYYLGEFTSAPTVVVKENWSNDGYIHNETSKNVTAYTSKNEAESHVASFLYTNIGKPYLCLTKKSANPQCTNGNPNYSLAGAEYKLYRSRAEANTALQSGNYGTALATFKVKANGTSTVNNTTTVNLDVSQWMNKNSTTGRFENTIFYLIESAAGKNYLRSTTVATVTVTPANTVSNPAKAKMTDEPVNDPFQLEIIKTDKLTGSNEVPEGKTLAGAQFRIDFYAVDITQTYTQTQLETNFADKKVASETRIITVQKDDVTGQYYADLGVTFPLGYVTVTEITPPADYSLNNAKVYLQNDKTKDITGNLAFVLKVQMTNNDTNYSAVTYHPLYPTINLANSTGAAFNITDENTPIRGNLRLTKLRYAEGTPIKGVEFEIKNNATGEKHSIYTDANGNATTVGNSDAWFSHLDNGKTIAYNADYGCLPAGTYTVTEKRGESNKKYQLLSEATVVIDSTATVVVAEADGKLYNIEMPEITTTARVVETDSKTLAQKGEAQTIEDVVAYKNLRADTTYTLVGQLMVRHSDGTYEAYKKNGTAYTVKKTFTTGATWTKSEFEKSGTVTVNYEGIYAENYEGCSFVVFEKLYLGTNTTTAAQYPEYGGSDETIFPVVHENIDDEGQTVRPADVHTTIADNVTGEHIAKTGDVTVTDRVYYTGLTVGETYTVKGTLHVTGYTWKDADGNSIKTTTVDGEELLDADGKPVTAEKTFKADSTDGYVDLEFTFDASLLEGESVVAFETIYYKGREIAVHADISDEDETVHFPNIHTTLYRAGTGSWAEDFDTEDPTKDTTVDESSKEVMAAENAVVVDRIKYHNLIAGGTYVVKGVLMDKATGNTLLDATGKKIEVEKSFILAEVPEDKSTDSPDAGDLILADGTVLDMSADHSIQLVDGYFEVTFPAFDASEMGNKKAVAYEEVYLLTTDAAGNKTEYLISEHKNINDVDQTVRFVEIKTKAEVKETSSKLIPVEGPVTINDTVTYKNLIPGKEYTLTARPVVKGDKTGTYKDGDPLLDVNGKKVVATITFIPDKPDGEIVVPITFEGYLIPKTSIVCYEDMTNDKGLEIAVHNDINDEDQTTYVVDISTTARGNSSADNEEFATEETVIIDTVSYSGLEVGREYRVSGTLMDKETGKKLLGADGKPVTAKTVFKAEAEKGTIDITFPAFNGTTLAGKDIVVFEKLYIIVTTINGKGKETSEEYLIAEHEDLDDEGQTVHLPEIKTTAVDKATGDSVARVSEEVTIVDTVTYTNLTVGNTYTVKGVLMVKETGKKLLDADGKPVTAETTFKAEKLDGTVDVVFTFDSSLLEGETLVVFEDIYRKDIHVATHTDIEDENQTIRFPKVKTKAEDAVTKENIGEAGKETTIIDTVYYWNLIVGKKYTVKGVLMNQATGEELLDANGKKVTAEKTFTAETTEGTVELTFTFDGSLLAGETVIVFEDLYHNDIRVAGHTDITDEDQSEHHPGVKTTAVDKKTGEHVGKAEETVTIVDTVIYTNLIVGKEYTVKGVLMDKDTGKEFLVNGKPVTAEKTFIAETSNGSIDLEFTFNGSALAGTGIVVFEDMFYKGKRVATHTDLTDEGQTVYYPAVQTHVEDTTKRVQPVENVTVVDDVMYSKLKVGERYQLLGVLVDKKTGKNIMVDGLPVRVTKLFTAEAEDGMITMEFHFDATGLEGDVTVFEYLSLVKDVDNKDLNYYLVAEHTDLNDTEQTFEISSVPKTGDDTPVNILFGLLLLSGLGLAYILFKKRRLNF